MVRWKLLTRLYFRNCRACVAGWRFAINDTIDLIKLQLIQPEGRLSRFITAWLRQDWTFRFPTGPVEKVWTPPDAHQVSRCTCVSSHAFAEMLTGHPCEWNDKGDSPRILRDKDILWFSHSPPAGASLETEEVSDWQVLPGRRVTEVVGLTSVSQTGYGEQCALINIVRKMNPSL